MNGLGFGITISLNDLFSGALDNAVGNFRNLQGVSESVAKNVEKSFARMRAGVGIATTGVAMAAPFIYATDKAMEFEAQMSSIKAVAPDTNIKELSALALQAGKETAFSATEAGKGIEELVKAGVQMEQIMGGGLTAALNLATAGEIGVADAAEIASTALNAFRADNLSVSDAANVLAGAANTSATSVRELKFGLSAVSAVASGMGFNFAEVNTALAVLAQNGLKGSDAGTSLKTMLQNLQPDTKEQIKLFKELGIITANNQNQFLTAEGGFKSLAEISKVLQTQLSGLTVAERAKSLEKMFGTDAVRAANIFFKESEQGFASMQTAMNKVTVEQVAAERLNNLKGSFEQLSGSFETLMINVGMYLTPILKRITDFGTILVNVFNTIIESPLGGVIVGILTSLGVGIAVATTLLGLGVAAFGAFNAAAAVATPLLATFATTVGITSFAMPNLIGMITNLGTSILGLGNSFKIFSISLFTTALSSSQSILTGFIATIKGFSIPSFKTVMNTMRMLVFNAALNFELLRFQISSFSWSGFVSGIRGGAISALMGLRTALVFTMTTALPFIIGLTAISIAAYGLYKAVMISIEAFKSLDDVISGKQNIGSGFLGFMQKVGLAFRGVIEVFQTAGREGFTLSENLQTALAKAGILDFVIAIGTWAVRIKEFFSGFASGFGRLTEQFSVMFSAFGTLGAAIGNLFSSMGFGLENNTSQLNTWATIGRFAFEIIAMGLTLIVAGITQIANVLAFVIGVTSDFFTNWDTGINKIGMRFQTLIDGIKSGISSLPFGDTLLGIIGVQTNQNTANGTQTTEQTRLAMTNSLFNDPEVKKNFDSQVQKNKATENYQNSVSNFVTSPQYQQSQQITLAPIIQVSVDGEPIRNNVMSYMENESARK